MQTVKSSLWPLSLLAGGRVRGGWMRGLCRSTQGLLALGMPLLLVLAGAAWGQPVWELVSLEDSVVRWLKPHPYQANVLFAGAAVNYEPPFSPVCMLKSTDYGLSWRVVIDTSQGIPVVQDLSFHPGAGDTILATVFGLPPNTYVWSTDQGETWGLRQAIAPLPNLRNMALGYSYARSSHVYLAVRGLEAAHVLCESSDDGATFTLVCDIPSLGGGAPLVHSSPSHPDDIIIRGLGPRSIDGGLSWGALFDSTFAELYDVSASTPGGPIYVAMSDWSSIPDSVVGRIAAVPPGQRTWRSIRDTPSTHRWHVAASPRDAQILAYMNSYELDGDTVLEFALTTDAGQTWQTMEDAPFFGGPVSELVFSADGQYLFAACGKYGEFQQGGLWRRAMPLSATQPHRLLTDDLEWSVSPNPFNDGLSVSLRLGTETTVSLELYNTLGQRVSTLGELRLQAGQHVIPWNTPAMSSGPYVIRVRRSLDQETQVVLHIQ